MSRQTIRSKDPIPSTEQLLVESHGLFKRDEDGALVPAKKAKKGVLAVLADDPINPTHYKGDYVMRIIEDFNLDPKSAMVVKYILRAGNKPDTPIAQDLRKAKWYLDRRIERLEAGLED